MLTNREKYIKFCKKEKNIPIFSKSWWLDALCKEKNWGVALVENGNGIMASMPYYIKKKMIFTIITMPKQTQTMGPYIKYPDGQKYEKRLSFEKKIINELIAQLPKVDMFIQDFHYNITNWLPFYWAGYKQSTSYTYVIEDISDIKSVVSNFSASKKRNIKRAERFLDIKFNLSAKEFYNNHKMTLEKQNAKIEYSFEHFKSMYDAVYANSSGITLYAVDKKSNIHSALFLVWDNASAYNLISSIDPSFRDSGSFAFVIKNAIEFVADKTKKFDFEGSMIEGVENSYRAFGGVQKPYFSITKTNSKLLRAYESVR